MRVDLGHFLAVSSVFYSVMVSSTVLGYVGCDMVVLSFGVCFQMLVQSITLWTCLILSKRFSVAQLSQSILQSRKLFLVPESFLDP